MSITTKTAYFVRCADAGVDCPFELQSEIYEDVFFVGLAHVDRVHGMKPTDDTISYLRSAIKEKSWSR